jgi:hypothetical protein
MKRFGLTMRNALARVRSIRPIVHPNPGFLRQLARLEERVRPSSVNERERSTKN